MKRKYAVVTGGSRGIGAEIVRALCKSGCDVIVNYKSSAESAKALCREINALGGGCKPANASRYDLGRASPRYGNEFLRRSLLHP